jgi:hypothetical protein
MYNRTANYGRYIAPELPLPAVETRRGLNVGDSSTTTAPITEPMMVRMRNMLGIVDDRVQAYGRKTYMEAGEAFGDAMGGVPRDALRGMGQFIHGDRSVFPDSAYGQAQILASRGLQAGGLTAAGVGLANLTQQMAETFGGTGDSYGDETLYM